MEKIGEAYVYADDFSVPLTEAEITHLGFTTEQVRDRSLSIAKPPTVADTAAGMCIGSNTYGLLDSKRPGDTDAVRDMKMGFVQQAKRLSQRVLTGPSTSTQVWFGLVWLVLLLCV